MYGLQDQILLFINHIRLGTGKTAPQHIDQMLTLRSQRLDSGIREVLPTYGAMTIGYMGTSAWH